MMYKVGLTGGMGAGKSTVARIFEILHIPIYFSDYAAKRLMTESETLVKSIIDLLGPEAYIDGDLNRPFIAEKVFGNKENIIALNTLVHPAVRTDFATWAENQSSPYVMNEAALHFETGGSAYMNMNISVSASEKIRIDRIIRRDALTEEQIRARLLQQMPQEEKDQLADFIIYNDGDQALIPQVLECHRFILKNSKKDS